MKIFLKIREISVPPIESPFNHNFDTFDTKVNKKLKYFIKFIKRVSNMLT